MGAEGKSEYTPEEIDNITEDIKELETKERDFSQRNKIPYSKLSANEQLRRSEADSEDRKLQSRSIAKTANRIIDKMPGEDFNERFDHFNKVGENLKTIDNEFDKNNSEQKRDLDDEN